MSTPAPIIGKVVLVQGPAFLRAPDGTQKPVNVGDPVREGDVLVTGPGGRVEMSFDGNGPYLVRENETVTLDATVYSATPPAAQNAALFLGGDELNQIGRAIAEGNSLDALLEETAAGVNGGGSGDSSHSFVQLLRIEEALTPLAFEFDSADQSPPTQPFGISDEAPANQSAETEADASAETEADSNRLIPPETNDNRPSAVVTLSASSASVSEGGSIVYTASVDSPVTDSDLVIALSNGQTITIPIGALSANSDPYSVRDNPYINADDTFTVSIAGTTGGNYEALNTTSTATTTVVDDADATTVTLAASAASVTEGGSIVYTASVNNTVTGSDLVIALSNGQNITIPVGQSTGNSAAFSVRADNPYLNADDTLTVSITGATGGNYEALTTTGTATTVVTDDADRPTRTPEASAAAVGTGG